VVKTFHDFLGRLDLLIGIGSDDFFIWSKLRSVARLRRCSSNQVGIFLKCFENSTPDCV